MKCHDRTHAPSVKYHLLRFKLLQYPRMSKFSSCPEWFAIQSFVKQMFISFTDILLVDKILFHLRWLKSCKSWDVLHINWCRIFVRQRYVCLFRQKTNNFALVISLYIINLITSISTPNETGTGHVDHLFQFVSSPRLMCCQACISRVKDYLLLSCERDWTCCCHGEVLTRGQQ